MLTQAKREQLDFSGWINQLEQRMHGNVAGSRWRTSWRGLLGQYWQREQTITGLRCCAPIKWNRERQYELHSLFSLKAHSAGITVFLLRRPSRVVPVPERCSPARVRFAVLTRALASCAPFWRVEDCDGRLRREHRILHGLSQKHTSVCQATTNEMAEQSNGVPQTCLKKRSPLR